MCNLLLADYRERVDGFHEETRRRTISRRSNRTTFSAAGGDEPGRLTLVTAALIEAATLLGSPASLSTSDFCQQINRLRFDFRRFIRWGFVFVLFCSDSLLTSVRIATSSSTESRDSSQLAVALVSATESLYYRHLLPFTFARLDSYARCSAPLSALVLRIIKRKHSILFPS